MVNTEILRSVATKRSPVIQQALKSFIASGITVSKRIR